MVMFFVFAMISVVVGKIWTKNAKDVYWTKRNIMPRCVLVGVLLGVGVSFWGGSFVKQETVVEKYFISPMFFGGKPIVALMEEHDSPSIESDDYIFQIKEGDETKLIKHSLFKEYIFFTLGEGEERYLKVKRSNGCKRNTFIWFFYFKKFFKSEVVLKDGDKFLTLPRYHSFE